MERAIVPCSLTLLEAFEKLGSVATDRPIESFKIKLKQRIEVPRSSNPGG
jgi:hypothetical protein